MFGGQRLERRLQGATPESVCQTARDSQPPSGLQLHHIVIHSTKTYRGVHIIQHAVGLDRDLCAAAAALD